MTRLAHALLLTTLVGVGGVLGVACSNEIDDSKLEDSIMEQAEEAFEGYDIGEVDCPEDVKLEEGDQFDCDLEIEDATVTIEVTQEDDDGNVTIEQAEAVLDVERIVDVVTAGIAEQTGVEVTVDCGDDALLALEPGEDFECQADAVDGSESTTVNVHVVDVDGNIEWELV